MHDRTGIPEFRFSNEETPSDSFVIERLTVEEGYDSTKPHRHNYFEIFFFEKGGGNHMIDFQEWEIGDGEVHILYPGQVHCVRRKAKSSGWVLKLTPTYFRPTGKSEESSQQLLQHHIGLNSPKISMSASYFSNLMELIGEINTEVNTKEWGGFEMIRSYVNLLLLKLTRVNNGYTASALKMDTLGVKFKILLDKSFVDEHRVSFYCDALMVTESKLNQVLKDAFGKSTSELIAARLLLEAKRFLLHSDRSIKEISFELGFEDNAYFNRWFKKYATCTPGEFRTQSREKYHT